MGMLRLIDDQVKRLSHFRRKRHPEKTIWSSSPTMETLSASTDSQGPELSNRWCAYLYKLRPGIRQHEGSRAHVSIVDLFPHCVKPSAYPADGVGAQLVASADRRALPRGRVYERYAEQGFGGLRCRRRAVGSTPPTGWWLVELRLSKQLTQSGTMRMIRKSDWKLQYDMQERSGSTTCLRTRLSCTTCGMIPGTAPCDRTDAGPAHLGITCASSPACPDDVICSSAIRVIIGNLIGCIERI